MKLRTKILFVLVFLAVVGVIFILPHGGYRRAVEAYKKELLAKGEKLTIAELAPPPDTNDTNRAALFMDLMTNLTRSTNFTSMMKMEAPGLAAITHTNLTANQMLGYEENKKNTAKLRNILGGTVLHFNLDYSRGYLIPLPHLVELREAEQLATGTMMQALYVNDFPEARSDLFLAIDLVRLSDKEPLMIPDLVRIAMAGNAMSATWEILQSDHWTEPELAELQSRWQETELFGNVEPVIALEMATDISLIDHLRKTNEVSGLDLTSWLKVSSDGNGAIADLRDKIKTYFRVWMWKSSWSYDEELYTLQIGDAALQLARKSKATGAFTPAWNEHNQLATNIDELHPQSTNHFLLSVMDDTIEEDLSGLHVKKVAITETTRRITVTAIALKRYHLQHNAYPASLNDLVPAFLPQVPNDLMDGKPLRYKLQARGDFLLYSVGEDGEDNGGDPTNGTPGNLGSLYWTKGRDIVWPRPAPP